MAHTDLWGQRGHFRHTQNQLSHKFSGYSNGQTRPRGQGHLFIVSSQNNANNARADNFLLQRGLESDNLKLVS